MTKSRFADLLPAGVANLVGFDFALAVDDAERADDDFAGRKAGQRRDADPPIPAERPHGRLDRLAEAAEQTVAPPFGFD